MKNFIFNFIFFIIITFSLLYISKYNYIIEGISKIYLKGHITSYIDDFNQFENRRINSSENPKPWPFHSNYNSIKTPETFEDYNKKTGTVAYLVIKGDSLLFEKYYDGYNKKSQSNSFSMSKSIVSALLGKAIMQGHIKDLNQKVKDFYPNLLGPYADNLTVGDLSSMSSGIKWDESYYSPFSVTASSYFVDNLFKLTLNQPVIEEPGKKFKYKSIATQLLAIVISKATGKNLSEYLFESFWNPMGFENEALWQIDSKKNGIEKGFCCLASNARDFARFGKLYKDYGKWYGEKLLDSLFVVKSLKPRFLESPEYGYGWWLNLYKNQSVFLMRGHLGQYVIVLPEHNIIIVRLGHNKGEKINESSFTEDIYKWIDMGLEISEVGG